jgi:pilus assembly protein CpaE
MSKSLKLLLVGQSDRELSALRDALGSDDLEITALTGLGPAALTWARTAEPDVAMVITNGSLARPMGVIKALAQGDAPWTVVALADHFEREVVRQAMLAGARDVLLQTSTPAEMREALVMARSAHLAHRNPTGQDSSTTAGTIITVTGIKGGIGKTTTAVNLAVALAGESGRSVALVDLDIPYGDLAMLLGLKPESSVVAALSDPAVLSDPELLQRQLCSGPGGIQVLPAPLLPTGVEPDSSQIGPLLKSLAGLYDFVLVDTGPGFSEFTAAALDVASQTLLVTTPEGPTLRRTELGIRQLAAWNYPASRLKVLVNRSTLETGITDDEIASILTEPVAWTLPEEPAALHALALGEPLVLALPKSELVKTFRRVAREVAGLPAVRRRSFWSTLLFRRPRAALAGAV